MTSLELTPNPDRPEHTPESILGDLIIGAHLRFEEAIDRKNDTGNLVWVRGEPLPDDFVERGQEGGETSLSPVGIMWFRLGELQDIADRIQEYFEVGIVVDDLGAKRPRPLTEELPVPGFNLRKWTNRDQTVVATVNVGNAARYTGASLRPRRPLPLVANLGEKLHTFNLHPLWVRREV